MQTLVHAIIFQSSYVSTWAVAILELRTSRNNFLFFND